jgi:hypothetical protein
MNLRTKPSVSRSEFAEMSTTVGKPSEIDSPIYKGRSEGIDTLKHQPTDQLPEVAEFPANTFHNDNRHNRILHKGCQKLLKMANQHYKTLDSSHNQRIVSIAKLKQRSDRISLQYDQSPKGSSSYGPNRVI